MAKHTRSSSNNSVQWPKEASAKAREFQAAIGLMETNRTLPRISSTYRSMRDQLSKWGHEESQWPKIPKDAFALLVFHQILQSAWDEDPSCVTRVTNLYSLAMQRLSIPERQRLAEAVGASYPLFGNSFGRLFWSWMGVERDATVATTAVITFATYFAEEGSSLNGPEAFIELLNNGFLDGERSGLVVAGLLMFGDRRYMDALNGTWKLFDELGRTAVAMSHSGVTTEAQVEYILRWMEAIDESEFGIPAAALQNFARNTKDNLIVDVERDVPLGYGDKRNPIRFLRRTKVRDFGKQISPRLLALLEREGPEKVVPFIMREWGIPWSPKNEEEERIFQLMDAQIRRSKSAYSRPV